MKKIISYLYHLNSLKNFKEKILFKYKIIDRYTISRKKIFKNSYQTKINLKIIKELIKKNISTYNSRLLLKYCNLTKKNKLKVADWGGGCGNYGIYLSKKNKIIDYVIYEKAKLVNIMNRNDCIKNYFALRRIKFKNSKKIKNFNKFDLLIAFGALSYVKNIYKFLKKNSMPKYIGISRLPLITNSVSEPILIDRFAGFHHEKFYSKKKLIDYLRLNYQILYFKEDAKGLPESKKKIFNYEVKSFNIFLKKKPN